MNIFDVFYNIFIYPIEFILETAFYFFKVYTKSSYTLSIFFLSLIVNFLSLPLYNIAESWQEKERSIQKKMKPMIDNIKAVYKGDQRYLLIRTCQRINGYKTIYAFRGTLGLLIQIPFFIAAYHFIHNLEGLEFAQFWKIHNFAKPDSLLKIGNISINVLPFIMTIISFISSYVYARKLTLKEQLPLYFTNLIFLVLLYNSPSGLLLYWIVNCTFSLVKNIIIKNKNISINNKKNLKKVFYIIFILFTIIIIIYTILIFLKDKLYYISMEKEYLKLFVVGSKGTYYDVLFIWFFVLSIILYKKYLYKLFNICLNNRINILLSVSISMVLLTGLFMPSSLIASSVQEFSNPFELIFDNLFKYIGCFFFYLMFIYLLFDEKIKNFITVLSIYISIIFFIDTFIIVGDYGTIYNNFLFENTSLLKASYEQIIINILLIFTFIFIFYFLLKKKKENIILNLYIVISLVLLSISIYDLYKISKSQILLVNTEKEKNKVLDSYDNIFNLSKNGKNVFIILLDRASPHYVLEFFNENTNFQNDFNGFTLYTNVLSYSKDTIASVPSIIGGYEYLPYEISVPRQFNLKDKYNESLLVMPKIFSDNGYTANMFNTTYVNLSESYDTSIFSQYSNINAYAEDNKFIDYSISNFINDYEEELEEEKEILNNIIYSDNDELIYDLYSKRAFRFSLFRVIPSFFRKKLYSGDDWFIFDDSNININTSISEFAILNSLKHITSIEEEGNYFNFIHNLVPHEPSYINNNLLPSIWKKFISNDDINKFKTEFLTRSYYANGASIKNIISFLNFLKENNVYDNTKIIIVSDHALEIETDFYKDNGIEFMAIYNALLMYKDFNDQSNFNVSSNFMTVADVPFIAVSHLSNRINHFTGNIITNDYKYGELKLVSLYSRKSVMQFEDSFLFNDYYTVKGNIFEKTNWQLNKLK